MHPARRLMRYDAWQRQKVTKVFTIIATIGRRRPLASGRRPPCEGKSRMASRNARLALKSSVAVAAERGARRRHGGCASSLGERRDRHQRDQGERGDEFPHDTSPSCGTLPSVLQGKLLKAVRYYLPVSTR